MMIVLVKTAGDHCRLRHEPARLVQGRHGPDERGEPGLLRGQSLALFDPLSPRLGDEPGRQFAEVALAVVELLDSLPSTLTCVVITASITNLPGHERASRCPT